MKAALGELKAAFDGFNEACVGYEQYLVKETDLDAADAFLEQGRLEYITTLRKGNLWMKGESDDHEASKMTEKSDMSEITSLLAMPKLDVGTYDGNPVGYPAFMKIFEQSVKGISDNEIRLLDCTTGAAKRAIQPCVFSNSGYAEALGILKKSFGDSALIVEATLGELHVNTPTRTPT